MSAKLARKKRTKTASMKSLRDKLDRVFSQFIRLRDSDENGTVACVTCGALKHWKEVHAGHFIKRQHMSVRWDPRNCAGQCCKCNLYMGGQQDVFAMVILRKHGADVLSELLSMKHEPRKFSRYELEAMIIEFKESAAREQARMTLA